jgi:GNAT superfamily N-acetyltransferase
VQTERLRERAELPALARVDRLEPPAEPRAAPRLDLADHERGAAGEDEIELADATSPIARDDVVAAPDVEPFDGRLAAATDRDALVHIPTIGFPSDMTDLVEIIDGTPSPEEYASFRAHVRWPAVDPSQLAGALQASLASVLARDVDGTLVGMGRVVGDGGVYLYLQDVIVLERWRNNGIGTRITEALLDHVRELGGPGTFVGLMAAVGAGPFYERFGFQARGEDRPGMWLTL